MSELLLWVTLFAQVDESSTHVERVCSVETYDQISRPDRTRPDIVAVTKFLLPANSDSSLLPAVYQNTNLFAFHLDFMREVFPDRFSTHTLEDYRRLVEHRATRRYYAGTVLRLLTSRGEVLYGFDFYTDAASTDELPRPEEVDWVYRGLNETFDFADLVYSPIRSAVVEEAKTFHGTAFSIYLGDGAVLGNYTAYTTGTSYGRVRRFSLSDLIDAEKSGDIDWRDAIIVDEAPSDLTAPVSCVITGAPQTELSHLNLRLAQRGTPNAFVTDLTELFGALEEGALVRVEVTGREVLVSPADLKTAEEFWTERRPRLPSLPASDLEFDQILSLDEIALDSDATLRFGAKAKNLGLLRTVLPEENVVDGFAVPLHWYQRFMDESVIVDPAGGDLISYTEYFDRHIESERFRSNPAVRQNLLDIFVDSARDHGHVPQELLDETVSWIRRVHGEGLNKVRFRSSSNLEDSVPFNGAGLYDSTSVCVGDNFDDDSVGPSVCEPSYGNERTLQRGFRRVWASLWQPGAFNERDFWQVSHESAKMGVLVTPTFEAELANGVVLSGNPAVPGDDRILINVQVGEDSVVSPEHGHLPEKILVEALDGVVTRVDRVRKSTLASEGEWVLSIDEAREIGELVSSTLVALGPTFETTLGDVLLDMEFKVVEDENKGRRIVFKQMRPFLRAEFDNAVTLSVVVPEGTTVCGVFSEFRRSSLEREYSVLSRATLIPGRIELPGRVGNIPGDFIEEIRIGPRQTLAEPVGQGQFVVRAIPDLPMHYNLKFEQDFGVEGETLRVQVSFPTFQTEHKDEVVVDEDLLSFAWNMTGVMGGEMVRWKSCALPIFPEFQSRFRAETGETAVLTTRHQPLLVGTGEENLFAARVSLGGKPQVQTDYWKLVYAAFHHNWDRRYLAFLPEPVGEVAIVELHEPTDSILRSKQEPARFLLLNESFEIIRELQGVQWTRTWVQNFDEPDFIRGDANRDWRVDISDVVFLLRFLFVRTELRCHDAGDANDDGHLNLADPVRVLLSLFRSQEGRFALPWPGLDCGIDRVEDRLRDCDYDVSGCSL